MKKINDFYTDYGEVKCNLKLIMGSKKISINQLSRLTSVKYDIVKKYYIGLNYGLTMDIIAKFCYSLECDIKDIITYNNKKEASTL